MDSLPVSPKALLDYFERVIVGKRETLSMMLAALIANGHVLIEDVPGVAKTLAARTLAKCFDLSFGRIQMTPDLLPADLTGVSVWDEQQKEFVFRPGPVFSQVLLADELNRATPRTQSGLLEAMEEGTVTADGRRYPLPQPFFVIATQNPVEQFGVFPLPEAQVDRFLIQVRMGYPTFEQEREIVVAQSRSHPLDDLRPPVLDYILRLVRATREREEVSLGASPRASLALHRVSRALALIEGEPFIRPDHVKRAAPPVLRHRLILNPQARLAGTEPDEVIRSILEAVEVPIYTGEG
jgi:MoxR-like ATPase